VVALIAAVAASTRAGARFSMNSRFASRDRPFGSSVNGSSRPNYASRDSQGFRSPGRATRKGAALPGWEEAAAAAEFDDEFGGAGEAAGSSSSSSLSCFVEVKFRGKAQRTAAVDSDMPMWNEQVSRSCVLSNGKGAPVKASITAICCSIKLPPG
jgi:hypothetical protein